MLSHPIHLRFLLYPQEMNGGEPALLYKTPKRLDVIVMNAASANPQPFALAQNLPVSVTLSAGPA